MLEELCLESRSLKELFVSLRAELVEQWGKAGLEGEAPAAAAIMRWDWRAHSMRVAVRCITHGSTRTSLSLRPPCVSCSHPPPL